ncbi:hypothetical protein [Acidianus brierleyi]|jgi:hypothetical protein|uniref:Uncharacterized protein n=1 Tax=Acidianus brierleyi TaxID=41673 RepID=A0A2U9IGG9_9CREN|nr:hypothetical protein [Acidianus brierleyi]AWR95024.1 hypothetical protein DFR85_10870 [Acidianus brierleyi]
MSQPTYKIEFEGKAKIGEVMGNLASVQLKPEDLSSPIAFQMAISRIYDELMKMMSQGPQKHYVAEIKFNDSMGNPVSMGVDFGNSIPPISKKEVKVKIIVEFYDED